MLQAEQLEERAVPAGFFQSGASAYYQGDPFGPAHTVLMEEDLRGDVAGWIDNLSGPPQFSASGIVGFGVADNFCGNDAITLYITGGGGGVSLNGGSYGNSFQLDFAQTLNVYQNTDALFSRGSLSLTVNEYGTTVASNVTMSFLGVPAGVDLSILDTVNNTAGNFHSYTVNGNVGGDLYIVTDNRGNQLAQASTQVTVSGVITGLAYLYSTEEVATPGFAPSQVLTVNASAGSTGTVDAQLSGNNGTDDPLTLDINGSVGAINADLLTTAPGANAQHTGNVPLTFYGAVSTVYANTASAYFETGTGWLSWPGGYSGNYRYHQAGSGADTAGWTVTGLAPGSYTEATTWNASFNHATNATYQIYDGSTLLGTATVNQTQAPFGGGSHGGFYFQTLGTFSITSGTLKVVLLDNGNGDVVADALAVTH